MELCTQDQKSFKLEDKLMSVIGGHIYFQTLNSAIKLKLFDLLEDNHSLDLHQISDSLAIPIRSARILLLGLSSLDLINKENDVYKNTDLSTRYFCSKSPENLISLIAWQAEINYHAMGHLHESMLTGQNEGLKTFEGDAPTLYERLALQPHLEGIFQDAMEDISKQANQDLAEFVDFSTCGHLVDIGGGNASNIINLSKFYPNLKTTVFDRPSVCKIAKENISKQDANAQCSTYEGNCFEDEFPKNADAFIFCHFLTIWSEEKNLFLLKKAYDALPSGGKVIIFNMMQNDTEDGPMSASMGSPYFLALATSEGMLYTWKEYSEWLEKAGFINIEAKVLPKEHGVIIAEKK